MGFKKWASMDILGSNMIAWIYTLRVIFSLRIYCHTWIKERNLSLISLLLQLHDSLQNNLLMPEGPRSRGPWYRRRTRHL